MGYFPIAIVDRAINSALYDNTTEWEFYRC